jgi:membrane fusion protein (multidrug efflux system)
MFAQISGVREVEVRPRVSGILEKWNFTEGSKVVKGQSLFTIDAAPYRAALAKAEATWSARKPISTRRDATLPGSSRFTTPRPSAKRNTIDASSAEQVTNANIKLHKQP